MTDHKRRILLTPREMEMSTLVASGLSNAAIAAELGVTIHTVRHTLASVFKKACVSNRVTLARLVFEGALEQSRR